MGEKSFTGAKQRGRSLLLGAVPPGDRVCGRADTRGGRAHCQDLSRTPTKSISGGRGGPRLREGSERTPEDAILSL